MKLFLLKPDLAYFDQYNGMMAEWCESGTQIAPWFLDAPFPDMEAFARFVRMLDNCEHGITAEAYASTTSYFVINEAGRLVGAVSLRHYLTVEGFRSWGHIGYGIRPSERRKGYGVQALRLALEQAKAKNIRTASRRTAENCGGVLENIVRLEDDPEPVCRYWIDNE